MALIDRCQAWWKLENNVAEIGGNFTDTGVTYAANKYNNGAFSNHRDYHLTRGNAITNMNAWGISIWVKLGGWSITNGHASTEWQTFFTWYQDNNNRLYLYTGTPFIGWEGNIGGAGVGIYDNANISIAANVPTHFFFLMNRTGIAGGSHTIRIYIDGILKFSSTAAIPNIVSSAGAFRLLMFNYSSVINFPFKGNQDNPKIWDQQVTESQALIDDVIANKDIEGFAVSNLFRPGVVNYPANYPFNRPLSRVA